MDDILKQNFKIDQITTKIEQLEDRKLGSNIPYLESELRAIDRQLDVLYGKREIEQDKLNFMVKSKKCINNENENINLFYFLASIVIIFIFICMCVDILFIK